MVGAMQERYLHLVYNLSETISAIDDVNIRAPFQNWLFPAVVVSDRKNLELHVYRSFTE